MACFLVPTAEAIVSAVATQVAKNSEQKDLMKIDHESVTEAPEVPHKNMKVLVIDAQGGGIGKQLVTRIKKEYPEQTVIAGISNVSTSRLIDAAIDRLSEIIDENAKICESCEP